MEDNTVIDPYIAITDKIIEALSGLSVHAAHIVLDQYVKHRIAKTSLVLKNPENSDKTPQ